MNITSQKWLKNNLPERILAIRLQAMGDTVATLPYLQNLKNNLPGVKKFDLLTREETEAIPKCIQLFDTVYSIGGERDFKKQLLSTGLLLPKLMMQRYDIVIDLQNNLISKLVRKSLMPKAWSAYDCFAPVSGAEKYRLTIEAVGLGENKADSIFTLKNPEVGFEILKKNGWNKVDSLVVLNPAGAFETRNWNLQNYIAFARLWLSEFPQTQFLVMGTSFLASKALFLKEQLGDKLINLVAQTTPSEAFAIIQLTKLVLSEDSGLMHMAWVSGITTIAMFGSTRSDWSRPLGEHTLLFDSSDLPCGNCMQEFCTFNDVHCLTRYSPEQVFHHAFSLINKTQKS